MGGCQSSHAQVMPPARTAPDVHRMEVSSTPVRVSAPAEPEPQPLPLMPAAAAPASASSAASSSSAKAFVRAIKTGDLATVRELLDHASSDGASLIERRGMWENTPLILACHYANAEVALTLIERGADPAAANEQGCTALLYACVEVHMEAVCHKLIELLPAGALAPPASPVYSRHTDETASRTPLLAAAENGLAGTVTGLVAAGAPLEPDALRLAAARGHAAACSALLPAVGVEASSLEARRAALAAAAAAGHENVVGLLCTDPSLVLATTTAPAADAGVSGGAAVRCACELRGADAPAEGEGSGKRERVLRLLAEGGVPLSEPDPSTGSTALHLAACRGLSHAVGVLLGAGAYAAARDGRGETPADLARAAGHEELAAILEQATETA